MPHLITTIYLTIESHLLYLHHTNLLYYRILTFPIIIIILLLAINIIHVWCKSQITHTHIYTYTHKHTHKRTYIHKHLLLFSNSYTINIKCFIVNDLYILLFTK